ncbi:hypothetical protein D3C72_2499380 [compost metagenome]
MAGGDTRSNPGLIRQRGNRFNETRLFIVDFVAVNIQRTIVFFCQFKRDVQRLHAIFTGEFKMRYCADHVSAEL